MKAFEPQEFVQERNDVLLRLDEQEIRAFFAKLGRASPEDTEMFWRGVHKARTAIKALPMEARQESKRWLIAHDSEPWDDGDVVV